MDRQPSVLNNILVALAIVAFHAGLALAVFHFIEIAFHGTASGLGPWVMVSMAIFLGLLFLAVLEAKIRRWLELRHDRLATGLPQHHDSSRA